MSQQTSQQSSLPGAKTYRGATIEEVLPKIRAELGPEAIILAEREGVVGGVGGFFAKKCVEVEAAPGSLLSSGAAPSMPSVPARVATSAYAGSTGGVATAAPAATTLEELVRELSFADLLAQADDVPAVPAEIVEEFVPTIAPPEPLGARLDLTDEDSTFERAAPEPVAFPPVDDETAVRRALAKAGFPEADGDELVRHAMLHARPFAPHAPLRDVVRGALAEALNTPLGWKSKRRVIVLAGTEGAGTSEVAAALCAGYARVGLSVGALGLDGVRAAVALATNTEDAAVAVGIAEDVEDVRRALPRLGRPDLLVAIAPTIVPGDAAGLARTAELLAELPAHDLHLVLPSGASAADAQAAHDAISGTVRVKGVLPVALDEASSIGGVLSLALREKLELRWTASGSSDVRVAVAAPDAIAVKALS